MIDTEDPARAAGSRAASSTTLGVWAIVLAAASALLLLRLPAFIAVAQHAVAAQADGLDDPALAGTAVVVGAVAAVAIHVLLLALGALLAALLERAFGPRAVGGRLRIGVGGLTVTLIVLGLQLGAIVAGVAALERSWPVWLAAGSIALLVPAAFPAARASATAYARALLATVGTAVLLCAG
ncbi:MAG: hypothetical protein ACQEWM_02650 [Actinomycetota bacterium]